MKRTYCSTTTMSARSFISAFAEYDGYNKRGKSSESNSEEEDFTGLPKYKPISAVWQNNAAKREITNSKYE